jgi:hypothetical protein
MPGRPIQIFLRTKVASQANRFKSVETSSWNKHIDFPQLVLTGFSD